MKEINLEEILNNIVIQEIRNHVGSKARYTDEVIKQIASEQESYDHNTVIKSMKEAVKQSLELAAENAQCKEVSILDKYMGYVVNKKSILNTINQVK